MKGEFQDVISALSSTLRAAEPKQFDTAMLDVLTRIGEHLGADRAYMLTLSEDGSSLEKVLEWIRQSSQFARGRNRKTPLSRYPWLMKQLRLQSCVIIDDPQGLPQEARTEKQDLDALQIQSLIFLPLWQDAQLLGLIGFDKVHGLLTASIETREKLIALAETVGSTLNRIKTSGVQLQTNSDLDQFMKLVPGMVFQYEVDSIDEPRMPLVSQQLEDVFGLPSERLAKTANPLLNRIYERDYYGVIDSIRLSRENVTPFREHFRAWTAEDELHYFRVISIPEQLPDKVLWHGYMADVTDQIQSEQAVIDQMVWTRAILDNIDDAIFSIDPSGTIQTVNRSAEKLFGYSAKTLKGSKINMVMPEPYRSRHDSYIERYLLTGESSIMGHNRELEAMSKDGTVFPIELQVSEIKIDESQYFIGVVRDITERKDNEKKIDHLAYYDPLTNLPNRRLLLERMQQQLIASTRHQSRQAILFLDLDNFKNLNDSLGHSVGDQYLLQLAHQLENNVTSDDTVARIGGDEFVIFLTALDFEHQVAVNQAHQVANDIRQTVTAPAKLASHEYIGSLSVGITVFHGREDTLEDLLKQADIALNQAKNTGKNTACLFDPSMQKAAEKKLQRESQIRHAMVQNQFELHYQPQILNPSRVTSVEALIRWQHPDEGWISPADFIPVCEESGLILELGEWVVDTACQQLAAWSFDKSKAHLIVAINISAKQFHQKDFANQVIKTVERTGAPAEKLELELTESLVVQDINDVASKMDELREYGIRFSLDDFGTGYSSLAYLKRLPFNQLKIDKSFVQDILNDESDLEIAKMIVALAQTMNLEVIAEGVETWPQARALADIGCHRYQGFLFARPISAEKITDAIAGLNQSVKP